MEEIQVAVDTAGVDNASANAQQSAQAADTAAVAAEAVAANQAAIISDVTAYAREDAQSAAATADAAATSAESSARFALETKEQFVSEVEALIAPIIGRLEAMENRHEQPAVVQNNEPAVTPIDPQATEQAEQTGHQEPEEGQADSAGAGRRRHGRRKR